MTNKKTEDQKISELYDLIHAPRRSLADRELEKLYNELEIEQEEIDMAEYQTYLTGEAEKPPVFGKPELPPCDHDRVDQDGQCYDCGYDIRDDVAADAAEAMYGDE